MIEEFEMTPELLETMYKKQHALQCYMNEKRGLCMPPALDADYITHDHVLAAIYFSSCVNIEWMELREAYELYLYAEQNQTLDVNTLKDKALEELVDAWHFILSVFIFLGLKIDYVKKLGHYAIFDEASLSEYVGSTAISISEALSCAPYKTWKDQSSVKQLDDSYQEMLFSKLAVCYNNVLDFALYNLDSNHKDFVSTYLRKNELNFKRQEDKSLGYLGS